MKSLKNIEPDTVVEFDYKGKHYSSAIVKNLVSRDMSVDEIKQDLDMLAACHAYWKTLVVPLEDDIEILEEDFDIWFEGKYLDTEVGYPKKSAGWIKSKVMLDNVKEYKVKKQAIRELKRMSKKIYIIINGYNNRIWTLREIARLTHAELSNLSSSSLKSHGSLADFK